jgi:hypothetical protein
MLSLDNIRWGYIFLEKSSKINYEDNLGLVSQAVDMHLKGEFERKIKEDNYEGILYRGKFALVGTFGGIKYHAEIETNRGKTNTSFIVSERTFLSPISTN